MAMVVHPPASAATARPSPRIVVTGITGHVGRVLARQLLAEGVEVHGLTRQSLCGAPIGSADVILHHVDGRTQTLVRLFHEIQPQGVIHLSALARGNHLSSDVVPFLEANVLYGTQLLEAMRLSECKHFVTAESLLQYSESGEYRPFNLYSATKQAFADLVLYYMDVCNIAVIALVISTIYSEYETVPKLMTDTAFALQNGTPLKLRSPDALIDFVHVEDVANAFVKAVALLEQRAPHEKGSLSRYCVTSGTEITPEGLAAMFERVGERKLVLQKEATLGGGRRAKPWHGQSLPGWAPQVDLETGVKRMLSIKR